MGKAVVEVVPALVKLKVYAVVPGTGLVSVRVCTSEMPEKTVFELTCTPPAPIESNPLRPFCTVTAESPNLKKVVGVPTPLKLRPKVSGVSFNGVGTPTTFFKFGDSAVT